MADEKDATQKRGRLLRSPDILETIKISKSCMLVLNEAQLSDSTVSVMKDDARSPASELRQSTYAKSQENGELGLSEEDYRKSAEEVAEGHSQEESAEE